MMRHDLVVATPAIDLSPPEGSVLDVLMLQLHVISASIWMIAVVLVALMAVPRLRRIPSAYGLHLIQTKRELVFSTVWGAYALTLSSGTYLLFKQAAYDPPLSGSDWRILESLPYGVPYYYALFAKIALFLLMGIATLSLTLKAKRAAAFSEKAGGPVDEVAGEDARMLLDEEVLPGGFETSSSYIESSVRTSTRSQAQPRTNEVPVSGGWFSVGTLAVGVVGIAVAVGLIKYFHELSKAAILYYRLTNPGS